MVDRNRNRFKVGCITLLVFALVAVFATCGVVWYGLSSGWLASTAALPQNKIPQRQLTEIRRIVRLRPTENILYFYSTTMTVSGDGNLFTNERVISYTGDSASQQLTDATYDEIEDIAFNQSTSWLDDSTITITLQDGTTFDLWVSNDSGRDTAFFDRLIQEWKRHRDTDTDK